MVRRTESLRHPATPFGLMIHASPPMLPLILGLMLVLFGQAASAWPYGPPVQQPFQPQGPYGQSPPQAGAWQFRPWAPTNAQGTPPAYPQGIPPTYPPGQIPGQAPGQMQAPAYGQLPGQYPSQYRPQPQAIQTRLEATLDEPEPYVQQPLLLRLRLITSENPDKATLDLPATGDALLQRLDGPTPESRPSEGGRREIVNTFILTLIPLRPGDIEIPPIKVTGTVRGMQRFESITDRPIRLRVRPAMSAVMPWLPLKSLSLKAEVDRETTLLPGQPVTLALELVATGGTAAQLPSLEDQLAGPDHRVYREQVLTESGLSADRRDLVARRTEYYTLVPQSSGRLTLPEIGIPWWNTDLGTREIASLPMRTLSIGGESGPFGMPSSVMTAEDWSVVWLPLTGLLLLIAGYWGGVFYATKPQPTDRPASLAAGPSGRLRAFGAVLGDRWNRLARRLRPEPLVARMRAAVAAALPPSSRFLLCVRHANRASDPVDWCDRFEADARSRLRFQGEATQPNLTRLILSLRPHAHPATLTRLMQELDAALYGRQNLDFSRWKRDFMRQVGRGGALRARKGRLARIKRAALPALNPGR